MEKKIVVVFSKRPIEKELNPFKNDPELILINSAMRIKGVDKKPQVLEGIEGIIFYHDLDSLEVKDIIKIMPLIQRVRVFPYSRHNINNLPEIITLFDLETAFEKIKELLG